MIKSLRQIKSSYSIKVDRLIDEMYEQHFITEEDLNTAKQKTYTDEEISRLEKNYVDFRNAYSWNDMKRIIEDTKRIIKSSKQIKSAYTREDYDRFDEYGNYIPYEPTAEELAKKDEIKKVLEQELPDAYVPDPMDEYTGYDSTSERMDGIVEKVANQFGVDTDFAWECANEVMNEELEIQMEEIEWAEKNLKGDEYDKWYRGELDVRPLMLKNSRQMRNNMKDDIVLSGLDMNKSSLNSIYQKTSIRPANSSRKPIKSSNRSVMIYIRDPKTNKWASQAWCDPYQKDSYYYDRAEIIDNPGGYDDRERVIYWDDDINDAVAFSTPEKAKEYPLKGELYTAEDVPLFGVKLDTIQPLNNSRKPIKSAKTSLPMFNVYLSAWQEPDTLIEQLKQVKDKLSIKTIAKYPNNEILVQIEPTADVLGIKKELENMADVLLADYAHVTIKPEYVVSSLIRSARKPIKSGKKSVTRQQVQDELDRVLEKRNVSLSNDVYKETVDYILSFWDDDFPPASVKDGVSEWYNDTKKNFPDVFTRGHKQRVASSCHFNKVKSAYLEYIRSSRKPIKSDLDFVNKGDKTIVKKNGRIVAFIGERPYGGFYYAFGKPSASHYMSFDVDDYETAVSRIKEFAEDEEGVFSSSRKPIKSLLKRN